MYQILKYFLHTIKKFCFCRCDGQSSDEFIQTSLKGTFDFIRFMDPEKERVAEIKKMGFKVIKAIKIKNVRDIQKFREFEGADIILFDTPGMEKSIEFPRI